ncbi:Uncharacterised protein [Sphingobacterium multivorum]|uniref:Uncharacterized protein n=1 Tax=Sphingobacterium multivorum TaxID=28454 RepID=A0A2X2KUK0_SPHMU|nr:Uncharacterised protein [Sphingobacterium multivorum]
MGAVLRRNGNMVFTVYVEHHYKGRNVPLLAVFILVNTDKKVMGHKHSKQISEKYIIVNNNGNT